MPIATIEDSMRDSSTLSTSVARFADVLLATDLPGLREDRRLQTVAFIDRRVAALPSITRFGVSVIAAFVGVAARISGNDRTIRLVTSLPIPLISEYPRLIRSLGYAFVWETWPRTLTDGSIAAGDQT
jgi:hypothetical protein